MANYYDSEYSVVELHYWLKNQMHSMDAFVQNKCEQEFLKLFKEVTKALGATCIIETEPLGFGGLRRKYNVVPQKDDKIEVVKAAVITAVLTGLLATPITASLSKISEKVIENIFKDDEAEKRKDEKEKLEIIKLKQEILRDSIRLSDNTVIERSRASFYRQLDKEPAVERVSFLSLDDQGSRLDIEQFVSRNDFKELKIVRESITDVKRAYLGDDYAHLKAIESSREIGGLKSIVLEDETIEVTSPNFTGGSWEGLHKGNTIIFKITSDEFNTLVQSGAIQFKKGSIINCQLSEIILSDGNVNKVIEYEVRRINYYFIDDVKIETDEGRLFRLK